MIVNTWTGKPKLEISDPDLIIGCLEPADKTVAKRKLDNVDTRKI